MTKIETETTVAAPPLAVWRTLLEHERWPEWAACGASERSPKVALRSVEPLDAEQESIGAQRRCTATLPRFPGFGQREVGWTERVTDLNAPWTIEYEAMAGRTLRRWRLRIVLVEQPNGQTRMRWRLSYTPPRPAAWLADRVFLRRSLATSIRSAAAGLARAFQDSEPPAAGVEGIQEQAPPAAAQPKLTLLTEARHSSLASTEMVEQEVSGDTIGSEPTPIAV